MNFDIDNGGASMYNFVASIFQKSIFLKSAEYTSRGQAKEDCR